MTPAEFNICSRWISTKLEGGERRRGRREEAGRERREGEGGGEGGKEECYLNQEISVRARTTTAFSFKT